MDSGVCLGYDGIRTGFMDLFLLHCYIAVEEMWRSIGHSLYLEIAIGLFFATLQVSLHKLHDINSYMYRS